MTANERGRPEGRPHDAVDLESPNSAPLIVQHHHQETRVPTEATDPQTGTITPNDAESAKAKKSTATELVELAQANWRFLQGEDGRPLAVPLHGPAIARPLGIKCGGLDVELAGMFFKQYAKAASRSALVDAMAVLDGIAATSEREVTYLRYGHVDERVVIDLGDASGRCVVITPGAWSIVDRPPVTFRRTALTGTLPAPVAGGSLEQLRELVNVTEEDLPLLVGWLVAALLDLPRPILFLTGEQGTGKSGAARFLADLIDKSPVPLRSAPKDMDQWITAASGSQVVALDNLSSIAEWLSDSLCKACTGDGSVKRQLYTDGGLSVVRFRRAVILTTIDAGSLRGDLGDRLVPVELAIIPSDRRRTDAELAEKFQQLHPQLFGAVCDLTAKVLEVLPSVRLANMPRMADFARVLAAIDQVTKWDSLKTYLDTIEQVSADVVSGDPLAKAILEFVTSRGGAWTGTATELLHGVERFKPENAGWPKTAKTLSGIVTRLAPALRTQGLEVSRDRNTSSRTITFRSDGYDARDADDADDARAGVHSVALRKIEKKRESQSTEASSFGASFASLASCAS